MSKHRTAWRRLKMEVRLAIAAWLVCKAQQMTPAEDLKTQFAFSFLIRAMISDDTNTDRCRAWAPAKREESPNA